MPTTTTARRLTATTGDATTDDAGTTLRFATLATPIDVVVVVSDGAAITHAHLMAHDEVEAFVADLDGGTGALPAEPGEDAVLDEALRQLAAYFVGERLEFDLPLAPSGTDFQQSVWAGLRTIPFGATMGYGELAARIGRPGAARAIGHANARNPIGVIVPCHRVIGADGTLTGFAAGIERKAWLLDHERAVLAS